MKRIYILSALLMIVQSLFAQGIRFETGTLEEALAKAKREQKMVFVDAYAEWCGPCKWMAANTFKDNSVGKFFDEHIVALKIDVERGEGPRVKSRYSIEGLPGYLFLNADGMVVFRESGAMPVAKFMELVETALIFSKDPDNVGSLEARFESDKNDEAYLEIYLEKLASTNSKKYFGVLEQYLKIQTKMKPSDPQMALFLAKHVVAVTYGGIADKIIKENFLSDAWRSVVRKNVRETYQNLNMTMARQTIEFAVLLKDSTLVDVTVKRVMEEGLPMNPRQRQMSMVYFYEQTGDSENYKKYRFPEIEAFCNSLDVDKLRKGYAETQVLKEQNPTVNIVSYAETNSGQLIQLVSQMSKHVSTPEEKETLKRWIKKAVDIHPENADGWSVYANILYWYGDKKEALVLKKKAVDTSAGTSKEGMILREYQDMMAGKPINL